MRKYKMPLGFSYRRWSSPEQVKGDTLRRQTAATAVWCQRNGVQLDESLRMIDAGVSAFRGKNLEDPDVHALAGFREAVRSGRVPAGSYLIVESFDRLSRDHWRKALPPLLELINGGIRLVQLVPEQVIDQDSDEWSVMGLIMTLARGRNESVTKSNRVGSAWTEKQRNAATKVVTRKLPGWVRYSDGKLSLDPAGAKTVRQIFKMVREGLGVHKIAERLNAERVPVLGRTTFKGRAVRWNETVVYHILKSPAVVGTYQPCRGRGSDRVPVGEPVKGYYPAVLDADEWHAVQGVLKGRANQKGGRRGKHVNLFAGLLVDARDGGSLTYKHLEGRASAIIPVGAKQGRGTTWTSYPADAFETSILDALEEVQAADIQGDSAASRKVEALAGEVAELDNLIRVWRAKMSNAAIADLVSEELAKFNTTRKDKAEELADAQRRAADPVSESWGGFRSLASLLKEDKSDELRLKARALLRRSIDSVHVLIVPGAGPQGRAAIRVAAAQVWFKTGWHRSYVIACRPGRGRQQGGPLPPASFTELAISGDLDLRKPADAKLLAASLAELDLSAAPVKAKRPRRTSTRG